MVARTVSGLALALLLAASGGASAASLQPSAGPAPLPGDGSAGNPSSAAAYNQAATTDPYNQPDFNAQQNFGLTAMQMLGAAALCEQLHADRMSLGQQQKAKDARGSGNINRGDVDAAQQHMLDPAAAVPGGLKNEADCDRANGSFGQLQQIQFQNPYLQQELDQPGAFDPADKYNSQNRKLR